MLSSITKDVSKPLYLQTKSLGIRILLPIKDSTSERTALRLLLQESAINSNSTKKETGLLMIPFITIYFNL